MGKQIIKKVSIFVVFALLVFLFSTFTVIEASGISESEYAVAYTCYENALDAIVAAADEVSATTSFDYNKYYDYTDTAISNLDSAYAITSKYPNLALISTNIVLLNNELIKVSRSKFSDKSLSEKIDAYSTFMSNVEPLIENGVNLLIENKPGNSVPDQSDSQANNADKKDITVAVDGQQIAFDVPPQVVNNRTMVPLRAIFEALGATVNWDNDTQTVTSTKGNTTIILTINESTMYVNGESVTLDSPAYALNGRTLVPVRAISEAFGTTVDWDGETQSVLISSNGSGKSDSMTLEEYVSHADEKISVGVDTIALIKPDHTLWMWGDNKYKQISSASGDAIHSPMLVMADVKSVGIGEKNTVILNNSNEVFCLGNECTHKNNSFEPLLESVISISAGYNHSLALTTDGKLYAWGSNEVKQIVDNDVTYISEPEIIYENVREAYAYKNFSVVLDNNGVLKIMGDLNDFKKASVSLSYEEEVVKNNKRILTHKNVNDVAAWPDAVVIACKGYKLGYYSNGDVLKNQSELNKLDNLDEINYYDWISQSQYELTNGNLYYEKDKNSLLCGVVAARVSKGGTLIAILSDSTVWTGGVDRNGSLGNGYEDNYSKKTPIILYEPLCIDENSKNIAQLQILDINPMNDNFDCVVTVSFKDKDGALICPRGKIVASVIDENIGADVCTETYYFRAESYLNGCFEMIIPYGYTHRGNAKIVLDYYNDNTNLKVESDYISGFLWDVRNPNGGSSNFDKYYPSSDSTAGGSSGGSSSGNTVSPMYEYYNNIIISLIQERNNVMMERNVRVYSGGRWIQTYDINKVNAINSDIEFYTALRDSYK